MKIKRINIENFRCFTSLDLSLEKFTSLVGENGCGKTAVLEAINLALSPSFVAARIDEQDFNSLDEGDIKIQVLFNDSFTAKLSDGYTTQDVACKGLELQIKRRDKSAPGKALSEEFVVAHFVVPDDLVTKTEKGWSLKRKNGSDFEFAIRQLSLSSSLELENFPRCFYFDKNRENQAKIGFNSTLQKVAQEFNWRFRKSVDKNRTDFESKWNEIYEMIIKNVDEKKLKDTLIPVKAKLLKFLGNKYETLELSVLNLEQPFLKSFFSLRNGLNQIDQSNMGSGISMLLSLLLLETISSLAKEDLIILIDEPELHLHPQLQYKLHAHLRDSSSQVLVSTHSEAMIDIGDWRTIKRIDCMQKCFPGQNMLSNMLEYKGTSKSLASKSLASKSLEENLDELKQYYKDKSIFFRENNEMLFARACILVEGPNEKYGLHVLSKLAEFNDSDLTVISCNGKPKIPYYQLICKAFEIPYFTLYDKDGKDDIDLINKAVIDLANNEHYYAFSQSFEHLFETEKAEHKASATMQAIDNCNTLPKELIEAFNKIQTFVETSRGLAS